MRRIVGIPDRSVAPRIAYYISNRNDRRGAASSDSGNRGEFSFEPIIAPFGTFSVSVVYRKVLNFDLPRALLTPLSGIPIFIFALK